MPTKTAFKRSLLNMQPLQSIEAKQSIKTLDDTAPAKIPSGFDTTSIGFSDFIERQIDTLRDSVDAISLSGIQDSNIALSISADPQRPELIMLARLFENNFADVREILRLRGFEASIDEADYQLFITLVKNSKTILKDFEDKLKSADAARLSAKEILDGLMEIALVVDEFRDSADFLLSSSKIHLASVATLESYSKRYRGPNDRLSPSLIRTFAGLRESLLLSNSALITTLLSSLVLPGSIRYTAINSGDSQKDRFSIPAVTSDPASTLLAKLSTIDVSTPEGFASAESLLPPDPVERLSLIADALSYELTMSVGLKLINKSDISSYLVNNIGLTTSPLLSPAPNGSYSATIRHKDSFPLETKDYIVDGNIYDGVLTSLVDPAIQNGNFSFSDLANYSKEFTSTIEDYLLEVRKLRLLDDQLEDLSGTTLIKDATTAILDGISSLVVYNSTSDISDIDQQQIAQLAYFISLMNANASPGLSESKYKTFLKLNNDLALTLSSSSSSSSSDSSSQGAPTSSKVGKTLTVSSENKITSSVKDENRTIEIDSSQKIDDTPKAQTNSAGTSGGLKAGSGVSSLIGGVGGITGAVQSKAQLTSAVAVTTSVVIQATDDNGEASYTQVEKDLSTLATKEAYGSIATSLTDVGSFGLSSIVYKILGISSETTQASLADASVESLLGSSISALIGNTNTKHDRIGSFVDGVSDASSVISNVENSVDNLNIGNFDTIGSSANPDSFVTELSSLSSVGSDTSSNIAGGSGRVNNTISNTLSSLSKITALKSTPNVVLSNLTSKSNLPKSLSSHKIGVGSIDADSVTENFQTSISNTTQKINSGVAGLSSKMEVVSDKISTSGLVGAIVPNALSIDASLSKANTSSTDDVIEKTSKIASSMTNILKSEDLYGLSLDSNGVQRYTNILQKTTNMSALSRLKNAGGADKENKTLGQDFTLADIKSDLLGFDNTKIRLKALGSFGMNSKIYGKSDSVNNKASKSVTAEFSSYLSMFQPVSTTLTYPQFFASIESVVSSIEKDTTPKNYFIAGKIRKFIVDIIEKAGRKVGSPDTFIDSTSCYGLSKQTVSFLCYNMCLTIASFINSVYAEKVFVDNRNDFDILCKFDSAQLANTIAMFNSVAQLEGSINDVINKTKSTTADHRIYNSLGYCEDCSNLIKERHAVARTYLTRYSTAVVSLSNLANSKNAVATIKKLKERGKTNILSDVTLETISAAQLGYLTLRGPASMPVQQRLARISESVVSILLKELAKNDTKNCVYLAVGVPAKSIETLRRAPIARGENDFDIEGKEYIEVEITKRDVQYSDLVMKKTAVRFCPSLSVIPQITSAKNIKEAAFDFLYLCHDGRKWNTNGFTDAIEFVSQKTGLTPSESMIIVYNHVFDSIGKLAVSNLTGASIDEGLSNRNEIILSPGGANFLRKIMSDETVQSAIPIGTLLPGNFLTKSDADYKFVPFSKLSSDIVSRTNESSHRLLQTIATDPVFTYESYYSDITSPTSLERVYMCIVDPDEFEIDKFATVSTTSGKSSYDSLVVAQKIIESKNVSKLLDRKSSGSIDSGEFAIKLSLVTQ